MDAVEVVSVEAELESVGAVVVSADDAVVSVEAEVGAGEAVTAAPAFETEFFKAAVWLAICETRDSIAGSLEVFAVRS